jgi:hypothetical protein
MALSKFYASQLSEEMYHLRMDFPVVMVFPRVEASGKDDDPLIGYIQVYLLGLLTKDAAIGAKNAWIGFNHNQRERDIEYTTTPTL